jgi:hypothetical protein
MGNAMPRGLAGKIGAGSTIWFRYHEHTIRITPMRDGNLPVKQLGDKGFGECVLGVGSEG